MTTELPLPTPEQLPELQRNAAALLMQTKACIFDLSAEDAQACRAAAARIREITAQAGPSVGFLALSLAHAEAQCAVLQAAATAPPAAE
ncbi:MAG: hypothetical protein EOP86_09845 [Verrucomicrobiaceae bacterium]|nr:MAG: hypothetical protein EOP86_09845 [Verrucomicrobiaceae bacterium]